MCFNTTPPKKKQTFQNTGHRSNLVKYVMHHYCPFHKENSNQYLYFQKENVFFW